MQIPQETLYKKNVLVVRGRFRPFTLLHNDMLLGAASQFFCDDSSQATTDSYDECVFRDDTLVLLEMTTRDMMEVCAASTPQAGSSCGSPCLAPRCRVVDGTQEGVLSEFPVRDVAGWRSSGLDQ